MVALNAAAAFIAAGLAPDFPRGIELARETIRSGKALAKLEALIDKSKSFSSEP
jgi:anthranilate phosphoribosyltransferase